MLPKVSEGLMITKEYFTDLFGRYVQYLIVTDCIFIGIGLLILPLGIVCFYYESKLKGFRTSDELLNTLMDSFQEVNRRK